MVDFLAVPKMRDCVPGVAPVSTNERGSRRTFPHSPRPAPLPGPAGENVPPPSRLPGPAGASPSTRPDLLHAPGKAAPSEQTRHLRLATPRWPIPPSREP